MLQIILMEIFHIAMTKTLVYSNKIEKKINFMCVCMYACMYVYSCQTCAKPWMAACSSGWPRLTCATETYSPSSTRLRRRSRQVRSASTRRCRPRSRTPSSPRSDVTTTCWVTRYKV